MVRLDTDQGLAAGAADGLWWYVCSFGSTIIVCEDVCY
jgi:hypothetical protein